MTGARPRAAALALVAAVAAGAGAGGCGGHSSSDRSAARTSRQSGTAYLQAARCSDWHRFSRSARFDTIRELTAAATKPDPENHGATLTPRRAYRLFERACSTRASQYALLYEIYNRAAAFQNVGR